MYRFDKKAKAIRYKIGSHEINKMRIGKAVAH